MFMPFGFIKNQVPRPVLDPAYPAGGINNYGEVVAQAGNVVFVGGLFTTIGGQARNRIAALDATTGAVLSWYPTGGANGTVQTMVVSGNVLFVGGIFTSIGGQARNGIAALDVTTGAVLSWYPTGGLTSGSTPGINTFVLSGNTLYVGGFFTTIGGQTRTNIAALDATTAAVLSWYPTGGVNLAVQTMCLASGILYIGGGFTSVGGQSRTLLAGIDATTGAVLSWNPTAAGGNNYIQYIVRIGNIVYVAGSFSSIAGSLRNGLAAFDATTGALQSWHPITSAGGGNIYGMTAVGSSIYITGNFTTINGTTRNRVAAVDTSANLLPWYPAGGLDNGPEAASRTDNDTWWILGGSFTTVGGQARVRIVKLNLN